MDIRIRACEYRWTALTRVSISAERTKRIYVTTVHMRHGFSLEGVPDILHQFLRRSHPTLSQSFGRSSRTSLEKKKGGGNSGFYGFLRFSYALHRQRRRINLQSTTCSKHSVLAFASRSRGRDGELQNAFYTRRLGGKTMRPLGLALCGA